MFITAPGDPRSMAEIDRELLVTTSVYLGAVILVALPVMVLLGNAAVAVAEQLGHPWLGDGYAELGIFFLALLVGLQLAVEAAALQLGGVAALNRGSRGMALLRHVALAVGVVLGLTVVAFWAAVEAFEAPDLTIVVLGALVAAAAVVVLYRFSSAFAEGYRGSSE